MFNADLLKKLDGLVGRLLVNLITPPLCVKTGIHPRILIIRPGGIGDAVLLAPLINLIKKTYPETRINVLAERRNSDVFRLLPAVDELLCYDHPPEFIKALFGSYDVIIDTEQWHRLSAVVARLVKAPVKIGFDTNERRRMFTHRIPYKMDAYEPDNFLALLEPLWIDRKSEARWEMLSLPPEAVSMADQLLQKYCNGPFVIIFAGGSIPEKRWDTKRFSHVARRLTDNGHRVVVVGGNADKADGDAIAVAGGGVNLAGMTTLAETAAVISSSTLVISGDSGVLHLAGWLNIPTVSLFGPSRIEKWAPRGNHHIVVSRRVSCAPCSSFGYTPPCTTGAGCMSEITVEEVFSAAMRLLNLETPFTD